MRYRFVLALAVVMAGLSAPAHAQTAMDALLSSLARAPNEQTASAIEQQIQAAWIAAATPAPRLLLGRGMRELAEGDATSAADSFDAALDLDPNFQPAWRGRAKARLRLGDPAGAARDLQEALRREKRDFAALQDLSRLAEFQQDWKGALAAWQLLLQSDPYSPGGVERLRDLRRRALGEAL